MKSITEDRMTLRSMIDGYQVSQAIAVMASMGIVDAIAEGYEDVPALANELSCDEPALLRLLKAMATVGLVSFQKGDIRLTRMGELLRQDHPQSLNASAVHAGQAYMWAAWSELESSIRTGEPSFPRVHGMDVWQYRSRNSDAGRIFDRAMASSGDAIPALLAACDFSEDGVVMDVGGGSGVFLAAILETWSHLQGILFEQPVVCEETRAELARKGLTDRCQVVEGDFLKDIPVKADCYVLKGVVHDWDDERIMQILLNCRHSMPVTSRLLIIDHVIQEESSDFSRFLDLHMLVIHGGRERQRADFEELLALAGFRVEGICLTDIGLSIIEARPLKGVHWSGAS